MLYFLSLHTAVLTGTEYSNTHTISIILAYLAEINAMIQKFSYNTILTYSALYYGVSTLNDVFLSVDPFDGRCWLNFGDLHNLLTIEDREQLCMKKPVCVVEI